MSQVTGAQDQVERETLSTFAEPSQADQLTDQQAARPNDLQVRPAVEPLQRAIAAVRRDAQSSPEAYLDETVVPHGGE